MRARKNNKFIPQVSECLADAKLKCLHGPGRDLDTWVEPGGCTVTNGSGRGPCWQREGGKWRVGQTGRRHPPLEECRNGSATSNLSREIGNTNLPNIRTPKLLNVKLKR